MDNRAGARYGVPKHPGDMGSHNCLRFNFRRAVEAWPFLTRDGVGQIDVTGNLLASSGSILRQLCLDGLGRMGRFHVEPDIKAGTLVPVLEEFNPGDIETVHAVFAGHEHLAARIRAFIDFLAERI